jgi:hypothetical protein
VPKKNREKSIVQNTEEVSRRRNLSTGPNVMGQGKNLKKSIRFSTKEDAGDLSGGEGS